MKKTIILLMAFCAVLAGCGNHSNHEDMTTDMAWRLTRGMITDTITTIKGTATRGMTTDTKDIITRQRLTKATITATGGTTARSW